MAELTMTAFTSIDGVMRAPGQPNEDPGGNFPLWRLARTYLFPKRTSNVPEYSAAGE